VKAGKMRIMQHKGPKDDKEGKVTKEKEQVEEGNTTLKLSTRYDQLARGTVYSTQIITVRTESNMKKKKRKGKDFSISLFLFYSFATVVVVNSSFLKACFGSLSHHQLFDFYPLFYF
jgi:hypothetical protein